MAVFDYKKYRISLRYDTKKTQGLKTGDIVRRQYFDGKNLIYSLMCVLDYGVDKIVDENNVVQEQPYFIGALLEGDVPKTSEILDFARITNLFDLNRSGALYLTASDDQAPYMDIIDGIGRNASLCWPENIANTEQIDSTSQYVVYGTECVACDYTRNDTEHSRICHIQRDDTPHDGFVGLKQDFYQYVANPNRVLISYKVKASTTLSATASLGYIDDVRIDGSVDVHITTEWQYKLHAITVDWSGRHLRSFKLDLSSMAANDEVWIADLNIILLSSVANFMDASQMRIGKLSGISDPVFGKLDGYGGYLQKLFASASAHISGTLTAGDENGFGSTFYAGKIHRNAFLNSLDVNFTNAIVINDTVANPTGMGNVYTITDKVEMIAQNADWLAKRIDKGYCFSFWTYAKSPCQLEISQNGHLVGILQVYNTETHGWHRLSVPFNLIDADGDDLILSIHPTFTESDSDAISDDSSIVAQDEVVPDEPLLYFTAPQLELGKTVTQYQPTDEILNFTEDYGAWFNRGGIGGTIQNPLLQLNFDGEGSIGTRTNSFLLRTDGSGYLANKNISWGADGKVVFGDEVTLNWHNLGSSFQQAVVSKSIRITGADTFTLLGDDSSSSTQLYPQSILLTMTEENITSTSSQRKWYYLKDDEWVKFSNANAKTLTILPDGKYWNDSSVLTVKCEVTIGTNVYIDTFTIRKQYILGYTVKVSSTQGDSFKNGKCATTLRASVYYQGNLVDDEFVAENFTFVWKKYNLPDIENEDTTWFQEQYDGDGNLIQEAIDRTQQSITLGYRISGSDLFICELQNGSSVFPYTFPVIF